MFCEECGNPIEEDSLFCSECGTKVNSREGSPFGTPSSSPFSAVSLEKGHEDYNGKRGKIDTGHKKYFYGEAAYASEVGMAIQRFLASKEMDTQIIQEGNIVVQGRKKAGLIQKAAGLGLSATVQIVEEGEDLLVISGNATWIDKVVGGTIGVVGGLILWPLLPVVVTAGWGVYQQQKLFSDIEKDIGFSIKIIFPHYPVPVDSKLTLI